MSFIKNTSKKYIKQNVYILLANICLTIYILTIFHYSDDIYKELIAVVFYIHSFLIFLLFLIMNISNYNDALRETVLKRIEKNERKKKKKELIFNNNTSLLIILGFGVINSCIFMYYQYSTASILNFCGIIFNVLIQSDLFDTYNRLKESKE